MYDNPVKAGMPLYANTRKRTLNAAQGQDEGRHDGRQVQSLAPTASLLR